MKLGTKAITREGFEYELTVNFEFLNDKHLVQASKDRTELFSGKPEFIINSSTGKKLIDWCNQGISLDKIKAEIENCESSDNLKLIYNQYPNYATQIYPLILSRKEELDKAIAQIVNIDAIIVQPKTNENEPSIK